MAYCFLDSSALAKRFATETGTNFVLSLFREPSNLIFASRLTLVEVSSALIRKAHSKQITVDAEARASRRLKRAFNSQLILVEVTKKLVSDAVALSRRHRLRAYDAVQLASAIEISKNRLSSNLTSVTFISADSDLNKAAAAEHLSVDNPNNH